MRDKIARKVLVLIVALSILACAQTNTQSHADEPSGESRVENTLSGELELLRELSERIAGDSRDLLAAASASQWGVGYAMLSRDYIDQNAAATFEKLKEQELRVRKHFDDLLSAHEGIRFAFVAYSDYMVLVERPWETKEERDRWRATSGGDMFPRRQFSELRLGDKVDIREFHFETIDDGYMLGVPVVEDGFAGAVYFVFDGKAVE